MKLISLNEWCNVSEAKKSPVEPIPQELKELCVSPDETTRQIAAYQLPNYNLNDPFIIEWAEFLEKLDNAKAKTIGGRLLKFISGERVNIKKALMDAMNIAVIYENTIYANSTEHPILRDIINTNIKNKRFVRKFSQEWFGPFICNEQLESLEGCPVKINGDFYCLYNKLSDLTHGPQYVNGSYHVSGNKLTNLKGSPKEVGGDFFCAVNGLTTLEGGPDKVNGRFDCSMNKLTSLEHGPVMVSGNYVCYSNELTTLTGAPKKIMKGFDCTDNNLTNLEGAPEEIKNEFQCHQNKLTSLEGAPKKVGGYFACQKNPTTFTIEDVKAVCDVGGKIIVQ